MLKKTAAAKPSLPYPDPNERGLSGQERAMRLILKDRYKAAESDAKLLGTKTPAKG